jgi:hypothetical protein
LLSRHKQEDAARKVTPHLAGRVFYHLHLRADSFRSAATKAFASLSSLSKSSPRRPLIWSTFRMLISRVTFGIGKTVQKRIVDMNPAHVCRAELFRGNGVGSAAHYFVGGGAWGTA